MAKKKFYDDDDGRTVADMSGVERRPLVIPRPPKKGKKEAEEAEEKQEAYTAEQKRALIGGSLGAALLVLALFALAIAGVIVLISLLGR